MDRLVGEGLYPLTYLNGHKLFLSDHAALSPLQDCSAIALLYMPALAVTLAILTDWVIRARAGSPGEG